MYFTCGMIINSIIFNSKVYDEKHFEFNSDCKEKD
jgi:hypothetical protein